MKSIGEILKSLREEKSLSMDEMVEQLKQYGVTPSKSMISRWENNKAEPSMEYARILSKYFNVSLDYLIGLSDEKKSSSKDDRTLSEIEILTQAAHKVGHDGPLSDSEIEKIKLAIQIALAKREK
ncbi:MULTISPECIES: helix-turn-helix transcriptional regulator [Tissierella]|uniref:helix-turn-helix domain-containing protein n=1 Tax=Tissierella TaxID=41273 RepID=UPI0028A9429A|nr:helix-turn-helix transcriptional regulator [Tissierella sp.]